MYPQNFILQNWNSIPIKQLPTSPTHPVLSNQKSTVSMNLTTLEISYTWNQAVFVFD